MAMTPEGAVKKRIKDILKAYGPDVYYFMPATGGYGKSGVSDLVVCAKGAFVAIEAKADKRKNPPTALQKKNLAEVTAAGGTALVIDANGLMFLKDYMDELLSV